MGLLVAAHPQPSCLSFRSAAEESAVAVAVVSAVACSFCLSFRSAAEESASVALFVILSAAKNPRICLVLLKGTASAVPYAVPLQLGFSR